MATVLLVRHGETTWNRERRVQGWADTTLSGRGREQSRVTGAHLASAYDVDRLVVSDLQRSQETARLFDAGDPESGRAGLDVAQSFKRDWRERNFGQYQGLDREGIAGRDADYDADGSLVAVESVPGGESLDEFIRRVLPAWESLLAGLDDGETVAVVTHGGPIRTVVADLTGADVPTLAREWSPANCGITGVDASDGRSLVSRDDTAHLEDASQGDGRF